MTMRADDDKSPDHKPERPHDRVVILATIASGVALVTVGHLNAEEVVVVLGALGVFYRGFRD
jgi:hypothetical protein